MMMLSGEWLAPCQARSIRSPPISRVRRSWNVSSFGGLAGSSSRSRRRRVSSCPMRVTFLSNKEDAPAVGGVDEVTDLVADAVGGRDLVDGPLDVVTDGWGCVENDNAIRGRQERRL